MICPSGPHRHEEVLFTIMLSPERTLMAAAALIRLKTPFSVEILEIGDCFLSVVVDTILPLMRILGHR